jgi:hypothetical protein
VAYPSWLLETKYAYGVVLAVGAAIAIRCLTPKSTTKRKHEMADKLLQCANFEPAKQFLGCDGKSGFAIDRRRHRICLLTNDGRRASCRIASHLDIVSAELVENGCPVMETSRESLRDTTSSTPGPANAAVLVAALTGMPVEPGCIWQIDLRILVKGPAPAAHQVAFLPAEVVAGGVAYGQARHVALSWYRLIDGFIRRAELDEIRAGHPVGRRKRG